MANIKSEKSTPFGGISHAREMFSRYVGPVFDKVLGLCCTSFGYQYSEIVGSLSCVYFCGGDCVEDVTSHLMPHNLLALSGWQHEEINGIEFDLNSIIAEKWERKAYRLVIQRQRWLDRELD